MASVALVMTGMEAKAVCQLVALTVDSVVVRWTRGVGI